MKDERQITNTEVNATKREGLHFPILRGLDIIRKYRRLWIQPRGMACLLQTQQSSGLIRKLTF